MKSMKIFNALNGTLYSTYGLVGTFAPKVALEANAIQTLNVHGMHSIRALWGGLFVLGVLILVNGLQALTARTTTLYITLVSAGLVSARLLGFLSDGADGMMNDQFGPLLVETTMTVIGFLILRYSRAF